MTQLTKLQIIQETVDYYSEDTNRRAVTNGVCSYNSVDNKQCAVGRCLIDPVYFEALVTNHECGSSAIADIEEFSDFEENLKEEYRGNSLDFWTSLQELHDQKENWINGVGLSLRGIQLVDDLKIKYTT